MVRKRERANKREPVSARPDAQEIETVGLSVVGLGYWGPNLLRNFSRLQGVRLQSASDIRQDLIDSVANEYPLGYVTREYDEVIDDPAVDAVVLATPAATHFSLAKKALERGKDVLVEKPLALSSAECEELIDLAEKKQRILMVGHIFLYNPAVRLLKEYVAAGELGSIVYLYSQRLNLGRVREDVNALWNFGPHDISIVLYLLGEMPFQVEARGLTWLQQGIEDVVFLHLDFPSGISAHIHISWLDPLKVRRMTVVGDKRMVVYDDTSPDAKIQIYDRGVSRIPTSESPRDFGTFGEFQMLIRSGDTLIPKVNPVEPLRVECEHFIDCIRNRKTPLTDGRNGLQVVRILEAAQDSMLQGGIPVAVGGSGE